MKCLNFGLLTSAAILLFSFVLLPTFAISDPSNAVPVSTANGTNISDSPVDNTSSTDTKEDSDNFDWLWNILGSGLVCAAITRFLDYFKEKKLRLLSAADALLAAFNAAFSDNFLERDDSQWSVFQQRYSYFCKTQNALIQRLKNNKHGAEIISKLTTDVLTQKINQVPGTNLRAKEATIRGYVGEQYNIFTTQIGR